MRHVYRVERVETETRVFLVDAASAGEAKRCVEKGRGPGVVLSAEGHAERRKRYAVLGTVDRRAA